MQDPRPAAAKAGLWLAALLLAGLLGGCVQAPKGHTSDTNEKNPSSTLASPGCDPARPAIVHSYDGAPAKTDRPLGIPCLVTSPFGSGEPSIGLTSKGTLFLYPAEQSPLAPLPGQFMGLGIARSKDQGGNWTRQFSMVGGAVNWHPYTADPFMYVDPATDRVFMEDLLVPPFNCSNLSFSDDEGQSWQQTLGGCLVWDHVSYGAGKPVTSRPTGYPTIVYRCGITYVMTTVASEATGCQKSLDGGMTWQPPGQPAFLFAPSGPYVPSTCNGAAHHVFVDFRGWVWLPRGWCNDPYVALSKDEGATWTQLHVYNKPMVWHDAGVGVDANGTVYYFWINEQQRPVLSISKDDGNTWTPPRDVAPPGIKAASSPNLASGGVGKVAITYGANLLDDPNGVQAVVTVGTGVDTDHPVFQTVFANPPGKPVANGACTATCPGQSDFITLRIGPDGTPWMSVMNQRLVGAARIFGAPSLWDATDPNGPYK